MTGGLKSFKCELCKTLDVSLSLLVKDTGCSASIFTHPLPLAYCGCLPCTAVRDEIMLTSEKREEQDALLQESIVEAQEKIQRCIIETFGCDDEDLP